MEKPHFEIGMEFVKPTEFRALVRNAAILNEFDVIWEKNEGQRVTMYCMPKKCENCQQPGLSKCPNYQKIEQIKCKWRIYERWNNIKQSSK